MALYRKYRPASFAEVVGQEQVTRPLSVALESGRINHAYLFSGPRGCGKTSSARILARSLNCAQGPTAKPCGRCASCISLAPGGPGNLDVTELDAASHRGVDDMRELRDSAYFAPAESRYRVFIIDEAHMITREGSNALLKIVEEPPEHLIFIFATTEPEKVIGTIRSRTHHYPFRLLTPQAMKGLLERTATSEGIAVEEAVYPLVIRAGGGSPRDSLSLLDQLIAGTGEQGLTYELALPLLGVTDLSLIDATVDALATTNAAALFTTIDDVIEAGHDPRRFVEDLLERLRDLMVLQSVEDAIELGLVAAPTDRAQVLRAEAAAFAPGQLVHLAATVNERVADLRGATSPRLLLEILCAHLLTAPSAAPSGFAAPASSASVGAPTSAPAKPTSQLPEPSAVQPPEQSSQPSSRPSVQPPTEPSAQPSAQPSASGSMAEARAQALAAARAGASRSRQPAPAEPVAAKPTSAKPSGPLAVESEPAADEVTTLREKWAAIRASISQRNSIAAILLAEAVILGLQENTVVIGHNTGALAALLNEPAKNDDIASVISEELGREVSVNFIIGTDPVRAGFAPPAAPKPVWNPRKEGTEQHEGAEQSEQGENAERTEDSEGIEQRVEAVAAEATADNSQLSSAPEQPQSEQPQAEQAQAEQAPSGQAESEKAAPSSVWGAPRPVPNSASDLQTDQAEDAGAVPTVGSATSLALSTASEAAAATETETVSSPAASSGAAAVLAARALSRETSSNEGTFSDGVPLPEEPEDEEEYSPSADYPSSEATRLQEEEEMMAAEAQKPGTLDRRDATEVAFELLEKELGARKL